MERQRAKRKDAYARVRALDDYERVVAWVEAGVPPRDIVEHIQARGLCVDVKPRSLQRTLERMRVDLVPSKEEQLRLMDELREVMALARANRARISAEVELERELGYLLSTTREAMEQQTKLLAEIGRLKRRLRARHRF